MKVILIILDAFRSDYLCKLNTQFLYNLSKKSIYYQNVIPSGGFCERTEIFYGLKPVDSGYFTAVGFSPEKSPYKNIILLDILAKAENLILFILIKLFPHKKDGITFIIRKFILSFFKIFYKNNFGLKAYKIPLNFLKYFSLTEDEFNLSDNLTINGKKSFISKCFDTNRINYESFTSISENNNKNDNDRLNSALKRFENNELDFVPIYIGSIDSYGHEYGPSSKKMTDELKRIDSLLEEYFNKFIRLDDNVNFLFLGDHGMSRVTKNVDVLSEIEKIANKYNLNSEIDYIFFIDSTILRMWFKNKKVEEIFNNELYKNNLFKNFGVFIDEKFCLINDLPLDDRRYGDLIWWANIEILIFPNFFNFKPLKGMHGYRNDDASTYGTCIFYANNFKPKNLDKIELSKIHDIILKVFSKNE